MNLLPDPELLLRLAQEGSVCFVFFLFLFFLPDHYLLNRTTHRKTPADDDGGSDEDEWEYEDEEEMSWSESAA